MAKFRKPRATAGKGGSNEIQRNLQRYLKTNKVGLMRGLMKAGLIVQAESQSRTPVFSGDLKASHRTTSNNNLDDPEVAVSVSKKYAIHVHERLDLRHPVGEARFLTRGALAAEGRALAVIHSEAKIRGDEL